MFCLAKENEENGEQEADNEVDEEEEEGGEEEDEEEEGDGNFLSFPPTTPIPRLRPALDSRLPGSGAEPRAASPSRGCSQAALVSRAQSFLACLGHQCWE